MSRQAILGEAAAVLAERGEAYGDATASMEAVAARWSVTLGYPVTPSEVVLCLIDLKLTRLAHNPKHHDSARDVIGYAALLAEMTR